MREDVLSIIRAMDFAARKHAAQRRKGVVGEPYVNHLTEVARLLAEATEGEDALVVMGGLLHDTIEDTGTSQAELAEAFGAELAALVAEVTDDKALPKAERKRLQVVHAAHASDRARMIKIADKTSNLGAILDSPPAGWDRARKEAYFDWAASVVDQCRGLNAALEARFDAALARREELA